MVSHLCNSNIPQKLVKNANFPEKFSGSPLLRMIARSAPGTFHLPGLLGGKTAEKATFSTAENGKFPNEQLSCCKQHPLFVWATGVCGPRKCSNTSLRDDF